jgi:hypothetical protein
MFFSVLDKNLGESYLKWVTPFSFRVSYDKKFLPNYIFATFGISLEQFNNNLYFFSYDDGTYNNKFFKRGRLDLIQALLENKENVRPVRRPRQRFFLKRFK